MSETTKISLCFLCLVVFQKDNHLGPVINNFHFVWTQFCGSQTLIGKGLCTLSDLDQGQRRVESS